MVLWFRVDVAVAVANFSGVFSVRTSSFARKESTASEGKKSGESCLRTGRTSQRSGLAASMAKDASCGIWIDRPALEATT